MSALQIIGIIFFILFFAFPYFFKKSTPEDREDLWSKMPTGLYLITFLRQSGNIHREEMVYGHQFDIEQVLQRTFVKAGIYDEFKVYRKGINELGYYRRFHNHIGRQEGKRVGGAIVKLIEEKKEVETQINIVTPETSTNINNTNISIGNKVMVYMNDDMSNKEDFVEGIVSKVDSQYCTVKVIFDKQPKSKNKKHVPRASVLFPLSWFETKQAIVIE